jgi:hypothetical protein
MTAVNDPRLSAYFTTVDTIAYDAYEHGEPTDDAEPIDTLTVYYGGRYGFSNAYANYSHVSAKIIAPTFEGLLMDYAEVEFLLAEAIERGYTVPGTAAGHYTNAVTASITYWGGTTAQATAYLAQPAVAYATATGTYKQKIGTQKWIALNNRGWDSWLEWRRLDQPVLLPPTGLGLTIPRRMIFPVSEQTVNGSQWATAAAKYSNDSPNTKLFWDVN